VRDEDAAAGKFSMKREKIIDVSAGICPLGPSRKVKATIRKAIKEIGISPDSAVRRLERLFLSKFGVPSENLLFANSLRELSGLVLEARTPKKVLVAGGFPGLYGEDISGADTEVRYLKAGGNSSCGSGSDELIRAAGGAELLIVSNPDRLTGRLIEGKVLSGLCDLADRGELQLVVDETLMEFTGREGIDAGAAGKRNVVTLRTTANYYGLPGLELAYAVSGEEMLNEMRGRRYSGPNRLSVEAAKTALRDSAYRRQVERLLAEEKRFLSRAFGRIGGATVFDSDSNVYLLEFEGWCERYSRALLREGFHIREWGETDGSRPVLLRMSVLGHDRNVKLARLMGELQSSAGFGSATEKGHYD
jgi:threonine-phosphate decarboxylase